ncbi:5'/3'-nucleotidase SurE [Actinoplanes regularis]|uniref:5'-nucleotidase n=1 Tax=Actinoplanes regularis TaxID=52697 RepID=A0A238WPE8_9ACTN|nr:5'/3'-nucleotidase SurE [Actinoplanes regularis]GIE84662.1 5'/3'-nucleotidase SurE [Actinoplanes regularis]SNR48405.1 5'-nucleotidase [Actinoplanes regularis]
MTANPGTQRNLRILITNDDGIEAPGIRWLARAFGHAGYDTVVAAPLSESSGSSASMTAVVHDGKIVSEPHDLAGAKGVPAYGVAASPAYIVLLALREAFGPPPDLVVSGINRGANAGAAVVHSGTVGATLTASHAGLRGLAVSLDVLTPAQATAASGGAALDAIHKADEEKHHWASGAELAVRMMPSLMHTPPGTVYNLNVPDLHLDGIRGLKQASLARFGQVQMSIAEAGDGFVRTAVQAAEEELDPGTDLAALADNFAVVTPIRAPHEDTRVRINVDAIRLQSRTI